MDANNIGKSAVGGLKGLKRVSTSVPQLRGNPASDTPVDQISIEFKTRRDDGSVTSSFHQNLNSAVSKLNIAGEATDRFADYVSGVGGMLTLAADPSTPATRVPILEKEAKALVSEIVKVANSAEVEGAKVLAGDPIILELEKNIGKTLRVLLPTEAASGFGLSEISFTKADLIIQTKASVERAVRQIDELRRAVGKAKDEFAKAGAEAEVAGQNTEAAGSSVRDLESALDLAGSASLNILESPDTALDSNSLTPRSLKLLEPT